MAEETKFGFFLLESMSCYPLKAFQRELDRFSAGVAMAETTGGRLRLVRGKLSQAEFASKIGVGKTLLGKYERDESVPGGDILRQIHEATGVSVTWLLTGKQDAASVPSEAEINSDALAGAIAAVEELLAARNLTLKAEKKGKLIALVYKQLTSDGAEGQIRRGLINDLLDLAS